MAKQFVQGGQGGSQPLGGISESNSYKFWKRDSSALSQKERSMAEDMGKKGQQSSQPDVEQHADQQRKHPEKGEPTSQSGQVQPKKSDPAHENEEEETANRDRQRRAS
jgi:hypothetical protein